MMLALVVFACLGIVISIVKGSVDIPVGEVLTLLTGTESSPQGQIIYNIRLPRTLVAVLVGVNLALAGAILQAVMKNPLADPHIIGISAGAGLLGILVMLALPAYAYLVTPAAFVGAMGAAMLIYVLAWKNGIRPIRIILAGVAVSAFLSAGISALLIFYSDRVHSALMWMVGGLSARSWPQVEMLWPYTAICVVLSLLAARHLNILQLGDEMAKGLGVRVGLTRIILSALAALLAASAVSVVGLLGFVGSLIPATRPFVQAMMQNSGLCIALDVVGLVIAALFLISDFSVIDSCVQEGYPKQYEWAAAFGLVFTVIWIYLKILDLLMQFAGNKDN